MADSIAVEVRRPVQTLAPASGAVVNVVDPYYDRDGITIYNADCRDVLPDLERSDLLLTDPPYNAKKDYGGHDDAMTPEVYEEWTRSWFTLARAATRRAVVFPGHGNLGMWWRVEKPSAVGCWYKPGNAGSSIIGFEEWEPWLYWPCTDKGLLGGSSVIRATTGKQLDTGDHPCPKPVPLMTKLLTKCRASTVIDPFLGSGTTLVAANLLGIPAIGIEINEAYCEIAAKRLAQGVLDLGGGVRCDECGAGESPVVRAPSQEDSDGGDVR